MKINLSKIKSMLSTCYELEGLLVLATQREESTPEEVYNMIRDKIALLAGEEDLSAKITDVEDFEGVSASASENSENENDMKEVSESTEYEQDELAGECDTHMSEVADYEDNSLNARVVFPKISINDRYLFVRELFDGSEKDFDDAIESISEMESATEVDDFLYNDLCFSEENPVVSEFRSYILSGLKNA